MATTASQPPDGAEVVVLDATNSAALSGGPHLFRRVSNDTLEIVVLGALAALTILGGPALDVPGSAWRFRDVVLLAGLSAVVRRLYSARLERAYDRYPELRTQPASKKRHAVVRDVTGRTAAELELIEYHDRLTMLAKFALDVGSYALLGRVLYAPSDNTSIFLGGSAGDPSGAARLASRAAFKVVAHHYTLSFGMYWMHRLLHANAFLWRHIHSLHHYARTPLARATYMDHWLDNIANAVIAEVGTQILCPLPKPLLFGSRLFRVCESLEKHSGLSGASINLAHALQRSVFPFAQMPHHHDWHHEGFKGSNYTFASIGGLWDVVFGTRHPGRSAKTAQNAATSHDDLQNRLGGKAKKNPFGAFFDRPLVCPIPTLLFAAAVGAKLFVRLGDDLPRAAAL